MVGSQYQRQVRVLHFGKAQCFLNGNLLRRVREMVFAPNDVRDFHLLVVHHHREIIERGFQIFRDDDIADERGIERNLSPNDVGEGNYPVVHPKTDDRRLLFRLRLRLFKRNTPAPPAVLRRQSLTHLGLTLVFQLLRRAETPIGLFFRDQFFEFFFIGGNPLALAEKILVPIQAEPLQALQHILFVLLFGAFLVGIFYAQKELAAFMAGKKPVK